MSKQPHQAQQPAEVTNDAAPPAGRDLLSLLNIIIGQGDRLRAKIADREQSNVAATIADAGRALRDLIGAGGDITNAGHHGRSLSSDTTEQPKRQLSILVADDNSTSRIVIAKILERGGHHVSLANDGNAALVAMRDAEFDVVLMDVDMPDMNGIEATKLYRFSSIGRPRVPILALTLDQAPEAEMVYRDAGMDGCVTKPVEPKRLLQMVSDLVPAADAAPALPTGETVVAFTDPVVQERVDDGVIDMETLGNLERLGGHSFVAELVSQFSHDAAEHLVQLRSAAAEQNAHQFREIAHALRSSAANVGATTIFEMCLSVRAITADELSTDGEALVQRVGGEIDRALGFLKAQVGLHSSPAEGRAEIRVRATG